VIDRKLVNRRGIYKDVYKSSHGYTDYQLRPNLCIAMSYAPELFNNENARICVKIVEKYLMKKDCMGIKTLDPQDKNYNGNYINSDASKGWNYHQGPEWVWPVGFFLKAKMIFDRYNFREELRE
jgi:glycogen debranching enzyme